MYWSLWLPLQMLAAIISNSPLSCLFRVIFFHMILFRLSPFHLFPFRLFLYPFLLRLLLIHRKEWCKKAPTGAIRTKLSKAPSFDRFKRDSAAGATKFRRLNFYFISISMCIFIATAFSFLSSSSWKLA